MINIVTATEPAHIEQVRGLWRAYWDGFGFSPCFQNFGAELDSLPGAYAAPEGRLLLALKGSDPAGAVAFRRLDTATAEAKRLFIDPAFRGHGIGRALMLRLVEEARTAGYRRIVGDTLPVMSAAIALYDAMGFKRIDSYPGSTREAICIEYSL